MSVAGRVAPARRTSSTWLLSIVAASAAACGNGKQSPPPPESPGCKPLKTWFEKFDAGFSLLVAEPAGSDADVYCLKAQSIAVQADGAALQLATVDTGHWPNAEAIRSVRDETRALVDAVSEIVARCPQAGIAATQAEITEKLVKARATVQEACNE